MAGRPQWLRVSARRRDREIKVIEKGMALLFYRTARPFTMSGGGLVVAHAVSGVQVHGARLAAAMRVHGVTHLLTLNTSDFERYPGHRGCTPFRARVCQMNSGWEVGLSPAKARISAESSKSRSRWPRTRDIDLT